MMKVVLAALLCAVAAAEEQEGSCASTNGTIIEADQQGQPW